MTAHPFRITDIERRDGFNRLADSLRGQTFRAHGGRYRRDVKASEFMLMHREAGGRIHFKHCDSRNYLYLEPDGAIVVPVGAPFMRGEF